MSRISQWTAPFLENNFKIGYFLDILRHFFQFPPAIFCKLEPSFSLTAPGGLKFPLLHRKQKTRERKKPNLFIYLYCQQ